MHATAQPKPLIVSTTVQFYDYTKQPIYEALVQNPPSSKFDVILEAVGHAYVPLYTHSEAYLAPNGTYISVGPTPHGLGETLSLLWSVFFHPRWAGGTKRQYRCVSDLPWSSFMLRLSHNLTDYYSTSINPRRCWTTLQR